MNVYSARETVGNWQEYDADEVKAEIFRRAGDPDLDPIQAAAKDAKRQFEADKAAAISIFSVLGSDTYLDKLREEIEKLIFHNESEVVQALAPSGSKMSRDMVAIGAGMQVPAHSHIAATVFVLREPQLRSRELAEAARAASDHLARKAAKAPKVEQGTHVFIGHGRSPLWRELKDFLQDKLDLPCDEFNRVPVAGITNIARLGQMLDAAAFAFLVLTAEDETPSGTFHPRLNVVHEAGLFQGKLGFTRAILLLEEGCEEFSNISGLGQIRFPKGNIKAAFQEIREVLERENIVEP